MKAKIYLNYFNDSALIKNEVLTPIQVGAENSPFDLPMQKDNDGEDNISELNSSYCEMTGVYWAWKNDLDSDYLGFFHYRRLLDFNEFKIRNTDIHGLVNYHAVDSYLYEDFSLSEDKILEVLDKYDAILPEPFDIRDTGNNNVYEQYANSKHQFQKDMDITLDIIYELYPDLYPKVKEHFEGYLLYPTNIFVFNRKLFEEMCEWLFPILKEIENRVDVSNYTPQERRVTGYLSERLISAFIYFRIINDAEVRWTQLKRVFINSTQKLPNEPDLPETELPVMSIAISSDSNYVPHLGALLASIIDNHNETEVFLDFIILDGGINNIQKKLLNKIFKHKSNVQMSYLSMDKHLNDISMHSYFAQPTLYRLYLPEILIQRNKILFLDTDMVVVDSLIPLYNTDISDVYVVAVQDLIMRTFVNKGVLSHHESGGIETFQYLEKYVELNNRSESYFQAGTLLLNLDEIRKDKLSGKMIQDISNKNYWFLDQDILNKHLGRKLILTENRWNVVDVPAGHIEYLTDEELERYHASQSNPVVIHYAGQGKPWLNNANPHSHYYWYYLRQTAWYETLLFGYINISKQMDMKPVEYRLEVPKTEEFIKVYKRRIRKGMREFQSNLQSNITDVGSKLLRISKEKD